MMISGVAYLKLVVAVLGFCGFFVAHYLYRHKKTKTRLLMCPMKFNCYDVIHSNYATFFGVSLEIYGLIYYAFITIVYLYFSFVSISSLSFIVFLVALSFSAFIFSIYLIIVQILILREGCFWCFVSAFISIIIFILTYFIYDFSYIIKVFT